MSNYEPRIADSKTGYLIAAVAGAIAIFTGLAAAGGSSGAGELASFCTTLCMASLGWAIVNTYVRKIELRLIDIQKAIETK